jgi:catechol 2,3-dioxygenase-like lactoylglutathione lyase family enzyme
MELGAFSISLAVKDLAKSQAFYEKLGFTRTGGADNYAILVNGSTVIGLFEKMFDTNILTFNPGLTQDSVAAGKFDPQAHFTDVRDIQAELEARGLTLDERTDPEGDGIGHVTLTDPDGNPILIDQHFPKPTSG